MLRIPLVFISIVLAFSSQAQPLSVIRGQVIDKASHVPISFASVVVLQSKPVLSSVSDSIGSFSFKVPVGRYDLQASSMGYESVIIHDVLVGTAKETILNIGLNQLPIHLDEITVQPHVSSEEPLNSMATVSGRVINIEEAKRYAGGFDDPARLVTSFAGVSGNTSDNGVIIRGNAPKFVQWKMEGIEIPSPNHFSDLKTFGGGTLTALSSQMLAHSDFFTGAFPAEYSNALSGVFDIYLKKGNDQKRENTFQVGVIGIDASSEGPFKKGKRSSYLFNYRYSTLALLTPLLPENANSLKYQDLSFKFNFPTTKTGTFSVWGIGFVDGAAAYAKRDSSKWIYKDDRNEDAINQHTAAMGASHFYFFKDEAYIKTTIANTIHTMSWNTQKLSDTMILEPFSKIRNTNWNTVFSSSFNKKFNTIHTHQSGITLTRMNYNLYLNNSLNHESPPVEIVNASGFSSLLSAYSSSSLELTQNLKINIGINGQLFTLNNHYTIEPRLGIKQQLDEKNSIGFGYGLHSRLERLNFYFNNSLSTGERAVNKNLDFTKAHHVVFNYNHKINDNIHLTVEPYIQLLYNVPVIANQSFSLLNLQGDWFFAEKLQNTGKGRNIGIDLTLEKYFTRGFYYLFTTSVFQSRYKGGDHIWRSTRYNRNYVINFLAGKEWQLGKNKQNMFSLNTRFTYQGGNHYSPLNMEASYSAKEAIDDDQNAYARQANPSLNIHLTASYKINRNRVSHEFALKVLNASGQTDFYGYQYNFRDHSLDKKEDKVVIPNLSYKIEF